MAVKIVTDSGSDLPADMVKALGITVVPLYIYFGQTAYKDGIDIGPDELYKRLIEGPIHPTTTQPIPADFVKVYQELSKEYDEIVSIHLSTKVSGTVNSALQGKEMAQTKAKIEVIDSLALSTGLGMVVLAAARIAHAGGSLNQVVDEAKEVLKKVKLFGLLETLKYLLAGGRITKAKAMVGSLLNIKPILTMREGELVQFGTARSYSKGIDKLYELVSGFPDIKEVAIVQSTIPDEAAALEKRISTIIPKEKIIMSRLGAGLGVHGGPGTLVVIIRQA